MSIFKEKVLSDSIEIDTTPEMIWDFFNNLEQNYKSWHPNDHVICKWIKGKPHEIGSIVYAEEILAGKLSKIKMLCTHAEINGRIEYKTLFPLSIFHPKSIYLIEKKGTKTVFSAINYFRIPMLSNRFVDPLIKATEKHINEEGKLLKELLERNNSTINQP